MTHKQLRWNPKTEEWFCVKCGCASDHNSLRDARIELERRECKLPTPEKLPALTKP